MCSILIMISLIYCAGRKKPPNVVLIMVDTLRADHLSCLGSKELLTPNIDSIAEEGFLFTNVHATAPTTLASTSSLMTSLYPRMHGAACNGLQLHSSLRTLPEELRSKGYTTAAFVSSFALHSSTGIDQGFTYFDEAFDKTFGSPEIQRRAGDVNSAIYGWLSRRPSEPFFLFVHYFDPHPPYTPPPLFRGTGSEDTGTEITGSWEDLVELKYYLSEGGEVDARLERMHRLYMGEVKYTDHEIGKLMDMLEESGFLENSLIVFTADHGETFWEHMEMGEYLDHGYMVYETTTHIPLIIKWSGKVPEGVSDMMASNIDIAPTIIDLLGFTVPKGFAGRSLVRVMEGRMTEDVPVFSEATKPHGEIELETAFKNDRKAKCVYMGGWKFIWVPHLNDQEELYNLTLDRSELRNLLKESVHSDKVKAMRWALRQWTLEVSKVALGRSYEMDEETREKLKTLGYVQ